MWREGAERQQTKMDLAGTTAESSRLTRQRGAGGNLWDYPVQKRRRITTSVRGTKGMPDKPYVQCWSREERRAGYGFSSVPASIEDIGTEYKGLTPLEPNKLK